MEEETFQGRFPHFPALWATPPGLLTFVTCLVLLLVPLITYRVLPRCFFFFFFCWNLFLFLIKKKYLYF